MANQNVDSLSIQITSDAQSANRSINTLITNLRNLSTALGALSQNKGLENVARGTEALGVALGSLKGTDGRTFSALAKSLGKISTIDSVGLTNLATALNQVNASLQGLNFSENTAQITNLSKSISQLGYKSVSGAIENIPRLAQALRELMSTLADAPAVGESVVRLVDALSRLTSSLTTVDRTSVSTSRLTNGFKKLGNGAHGLKNAFSKIGSGIKNASTNLIHFATTEEKATKTTSTFAHNVGLLYARFWALFHLFRGIGSAIGSAMNYLETVNYFNASFDQVAERGVDSWKSAGYDSADAYYDSFKGRARELNKKLTGYVVNDQGLLESTGLTSLGLNPTTTLQYQSLYAQMASSMGVASEQAMILSQVLTELGADLASVKDMKFEDVWQDMASGLTGMSRTLDKYGVNIRNANLQTKLAELGINATVNSLSQADKAMLRTIVLIDSTRYAWGDLALTLNSPSNQLRVLRSNFETLAKMLGSLFLPIVQKVLPYINGLVIALQRLVMTIARFFKIDLSKFTKSTGSAMDNLGGAGDETDDLADSLDDADKEAKKLKNHLLGIDELNIMNESDSGKNVNASDISDKLAGALADAWDEYQKAWDDAFAQLQNRAQEIADAIEAWAKKVFEPIKKAWDNVGDYVKQRWEHLKNALVELFKSIARDWAEVWAQDNTVKIFEAIFKTVGNIFEIVANLADKLREAWDEGEKGKRILEGIRDIVMIIAQHIEYWTKSLADFTAKLNFNPIFESFLKLVIAIRDNLDDALGILDDFVDYFAEPALKWFIETFMPRLLDGFASLVNAINWVQLRESLKDIFIALEKIGEVLGGWLLTGLEKLEKIVANFVNSGWFRKLADDLMNLADGLKGASSLGEILTAIFDFGDARIEDFAGFINIVIESLNNFFKTLNSVDPKTGQKPLDTIGKRLGGLINTFFENWDASGSGKLITNIITSLVRIIDDIIKSINWFEVGSKIADMLRNINWIQILWEVGKLIVDVLVSAVKAWIPILFKAPISSAIIGALTLLSFGKMGIQFALKLAQAFGGESVIGIISKGIKGAIQKAIGKSAVSEVATTVAEAEATTLPYDLTFFGGSSALSGVLGVIKTIGGVLATIGGTIMAIVNFTKMWKEGFDGLHEVLMIVGIAIAGIGAVLLGAPALIVAIVGAVVAGIATLGVLIHDNWDSIVAWWEESIVPWFKNAGENIKTFFTETIPNAIGNMGKFFADKWDGIKESSTQKWDEIKEAISGKLDALKDKISTKWSEIKKNFETFLSEWRDKISSWASEKWDSITTKLEEVRNRIQEKWNIIRDNFGQFINEWRTKITEWATIRWEEITNKLESIRQGIENKWNELKQNFSDFIVEWRKRITEWAETKWEEITDKVEEVRAKIQTKWEEIQQNFTDHISQWRDRITQWANEKWDEVLDAIETLRKNILDKWEELKSEFSQFISEWQDRIVQWATEKWDEVVNAIEELKGKIKEKWEQLKEDFSNFISEWGEKISQWASDKWEEVTNAIENLRNAIQSKWEEIKNDASNAWSNIRNTLSNKASEVVSSIVSAFQGLPSAIAGIWGSITSTATSAFNNLKNTTSNIVSNISNSVSNVAEGISNLASNVKSSSAIQTVANGIDDLKKKLTGKAYATGGFPEDGMFFANHSELVGKFSNGKTVVANNQQITQGIADATYSAFVKANMDSSSREEELLQQLINAVKQGSKVVIDGREIVTAYDTRKARNGYAF